MVGGAVPSAMPSSRTSSTAMFQAPLAGGSSSRRQAVSDVEAKEGDIAILHDIVAPLEPHLPALAGRRVRSRCDQVIVGDDLRLDKPTFDVAVDHAGSLGRFRPLSNGPRADLRIAGGEEGDEVEQSVGRVDEGWEGGLFQTRVLEEDRGLVVR